MMHKGRILFVSFWIFDAERMPSGDTNGNGTVDITDVNAVINMMLGKVEQTPTADINGDGNVDIADVNAVINLMLGKWQFYR